MSVKVYATYFRSASSPSESLLLYEGDYLVGPYPTAVGSWRILQPQSTMIIYMCVSVCVCVCVFVCVCEKYKAFDNIRKKQGNQTHVYKTSLMNSHWVAEEGPTPFPLLLHFTLIMMSVKQGGIKYQFLRPSYDSTWDWIMVSGAIGEHSTL